MIQEAFAFKESAMHRMDPRLRLAFWGRFSVAAALARQPAALFAFLGVSLFLVILARLPLGGVFKRLLVVNGFIVFLWLMLPWSTPGRAVYALGPVSITQEGLDLALAITLKSNAIVLFTLALVATMSVAKLGQAAHRLGAPDKLVHLLLMTYRYLFVIANEYTSLSRAARIRNFTPKTGLHTYRTYAYFLGMLFVRAHDRARRVHQAMVCRGFDGRFVCLDLFCFRRADWAWTALFLFVLIGLEAAEWTPMML